MKTTEKHTKARDSAGVGRSSGGREGVVPHGDALDERGFAPRPSARPSPPLASRAMTADFAYERVVHERCLRCGRDVSTIPPGDLAPSIIDAARQWQDFVDAVLADPDGAAWLRVQGSGWSGVEYAAHVRDVLSLFTRRIEIVVLVDEPDLTWWDHEAAAIEEHYREQDPRAVADDIVEAAEELAFVLQRLRPTQRLRVGIRRGHRFTIDGLARFALHETLHHLDDARTVVPRP